MSPHSPAATSAAPATPAVTSTSKRSPWGCHQVPWRSGGWTSGKASRKVPSPVPVTGKRRQSASSAPCSRRRAPQLTSAAEVASRRPSPSRQPTAATAATPASATRAPSGASHQRRRSPAATSSPWTETAATAASRPPREPVKERPVNSVSQSIAGGATRTIRRSIRISSRARRNAHQLQAKATGSAISR